MSCIVDLSNIVDVSMNKVALLSVQVDGWTADEQLLLFRCSIGLLLFALSYGWLAEGNLKLNTQLFFFYKKQIGQMEVLMTNHGTQLITTVT